MINKINTIILLIVIFIFSSCSSSYNKPFINTEETIKLRENMTEEMVLEEIGQPLYVRSGDFDSNEVIWVYEVRTILIKSDLLTGEPNKFYSEDSKFMSLKETRSSFPSSKHSTPQHKLQITFKNGKVKSWNKFIDKDTKLNEKKSNNKTNKKSGKFYFSPKYGMSSHTQFGGTRHFGFSFGKGPFSFDFINAGSDYIGEGSELGQSIMIVYEKKYGNIFLQAGLGHTQADWLTVEDYNNNWHTYNVWHESESKAFRLGLGYERKILPRFILRPTIEANIPFESRKSGIVAYSLNVRFK